MGVHNKLYTFLICGHYVCSLKHETAWQCNKLYNNLYQTKNDIPWIGNLRFCTEEMLNFAAPVQMAKYIYDRCIGKFWPQLYV